MYAFTLFFQLCAKNGNPEFQISISRESSLSDIF